MLGFLSCKLVVLQCSRLDVREGIRFSVVRGGILGNGMIKNLERVG